MAPIPAVCQTCGRLFVTTNLVAGTGTVSFQGSVVGPCPYCGGMGRIPDGVYELTENVVRYFVQSGLSRQQLFTLRSVIQDAATNPGADVADRIANDVPQASGLLPLLLSNGGVPLATWLMFIVAVIGIILASGHGSLSEAQIEQIIERALTPTAAPVVSPAAATPTASPRVGRNQPCPCGSGKKYKYCHLGTGS